MNLSPKGLDTFRVLGPTDGRLPRPHRQRGRDDRPPPPERSHHRHVLRLRRAHPDILRLYGRGECRARATDELGRRWPTGFPDLPGRPVDHPRRASTGSPTRAATRCPGWTLVGPRDRLVDWADDQGRRRPRRLPGREEPREHRRPARARCHPRSDRLMFTDRMARVRAAMADAGVDVAAAVGRARPAVADRLRGHAARAAHHAGRAPRRRRHAGRAPAGGAPGRRAARRRSPSAPWDETEDPVAIVAGLVGPAGTRRHRRPHLGPLRRSTSRRRCPTTRFGAGPATVTGPLRAVKDAAEVAALRGRGRGRRPGRGRSSRRARSRSSAAPRPRCRPTSAAGCVAEGHHRVNFAIVAAGPERRQPAPRAGRPGDRAGRGRAVRLRRHHARPPTAPATARTSPAASTSASRPPRWPRSTPCCTTAQAAAVAAATVGTTCEAVDAAARERHHRGRLRRPLHAPHRPRHRRRGARGPLHRRRQRRRRWRPATPSRSSPASTSPGRWGLRLEDIVVATDDGPEPLNRVDHDLVVVDG